MKPNSQTVMLGGKPINLSEISRETGLSVSFLSRIMAGTRDPSLATLKLLAEHLGYTLDELVNLIS